MRKITLLLICLAAAWSAVAKVRLPEIIGDGMVLQQNSRVNLWGWADPGAWVEIVTSWGESCRVESDERGHWTAQVETPAGSYEPRRIGITCGETLAVEDVLIGEVWLASGQSNMEMPLGGMWQSPVEGANETIARAGARRGRLHYVKIPKAQATTPQDEVPGRWRQCTPETAPQFSAAAYFFAELLNDALDVPVGIVDCSWSGSRIECWMSRELLADCPDIDLTQQGIADVPEHLRPAAMFNAMLHPIARYTIRGFLWYQGESNVERYAEYADRMAGMVALWRSLWRQDDLPFYFVELAPYEYGHGCGPFLREAQCRAQEMIPNSGMVCTNDLAEPWEACNIHPRNKRDVGKRLAFLALNRCYGMRSVACESPRFESLEICGGEARVRFTHTRDGFSRMAGIRGFEICGADRVFYPARAEVRGVEILLTSPQVTQPVAVRYGFRDFLPGNLANLRGLPVVPFRTDDF